MSDGKSVSVSVGPSVLGLLGVALVVLKLLGKIDWSWAAVTAPFWLPLALIAAFLLVFAVLAAIAAALK